MMMKSPALLVLLASCAGSRAGSSSSARSSGCQLPAGATKIRFLLLRSENRGAYRPVAMEGLVPDDLCQMGVDAKGVQDAVAFTKLLDDRRCGGAAVSSFGGWNVRFYAGMNGQPQVQGVMESAAAVHVLIQQTVGGMPGGAQDEQTYAIVFPATTKPIVDCTSVTDLGHYEGPMPP